ncbi:hypothetical protein FD46_GL000952 [Liquorilactobacillus oeni DSM 19972]|uniref:Uncharacterized protein n=1 Tax=Liquorilactobacillus oeni DSM 19972 TaxID=1423777 RepID=A0A0R1MMM3_9LACO|nr:hypothetical protein FD46_GL000952 [Liquorilactobacillus oeni DSM 19972]
MINGLEAEFSLKTAFVCIFKTFCLIFLLKNNEVYKFNVYVIFSFLFLFILKKKTHSSRNKPGFCPEIHTLKTFVTIM